ncbi:MAG: hypothetical protein ABSG10_07610 [Terracidiphilus sp.]
MTERSISNAEGWAVLAFCMVASTAAIFWSWRHGAMLNYGDAVAHLHIARRVFDSRTPRFSLLGSVWLPLPHILLIPFVQNYEWWATGLAGVLPSALAYIASCAGIYRLARRWLNPAAAALALVFFALNPNLLYMQTTAMTEPLFLCEAIWIVVWMVEWRAALDQETEAASYTLPPGSSAHPGLRRPIAPAARQRLRIPLRIFEAPGPRRGAWLGNPLAQPAPRTNVVIAQTARLQACIAAALVAAIFTRYDGWIIALLAWSGVGLTLFRRAAAGERGRLASPAFWLASLAVVAAPILWFVYNSVGFGDWLYFARGPYSAHAIELRTAARGGLPHPGWHNPWVALLYYLKVSALDSTAAHAWGNAWGNIVIALAALATAAALFAKGTADRTRASAWILLLWLPVPFYTWSVAYGSVPIFFPAWWPYTWYNTRYGIELLPALALGVGFAAQLAENALRQFKLPRLRPLLPRFAPFLPRIAFVFLFALAGLNVYLLLRADPIVYVESTKNADARQPYDDAIPPALQSLLTVFPRATVLMNTSAYPEIVAFTGIPLRQTINESDLGIFRAALAAPAAQAAIVLAFDGDEVDRAVKAHPADLVIAGRFTAQDQPSATIYVSSKWLEHGPAPF